MSPSHGPLYLNTTIPDEILEEILGWLLTSELLRSVSKVSTRFRRLAKGDQFWQRKLIEVVQQQTCRDYEDGEHSYDPPVGLTQHQVQRCCWLLEHKMHEQHDQGTADDTDKTDGESKSSRESGRSAPPSFLQHGTLLFSRLESFRLLHDRENGVQRVLNLATSTDHHHETIENVLDEENRSREETADWHRIRNDDRVSDVTIMSGRQASLFSFRQPWWSSIPRSDQDMSETLAFCTRYPLTLVTEVAIKPYADWTMQTYSWKKLIVRVYHLPSLAPTIEDDWDDDERPARNYTFRTLCPSTISTGHSMPSPSSTVGESKSISNTFQFLESQTPVYESPLLDTPPPRNNAWQYHDVPFGVVGNVITFTLVGKNFRQFEESGYYACVQRVVAQGIPLYESKEAANPDPDKVYVPGMMAKRALAMYMTSKVVPLLVRNVR